MSIETPSLLHGLSIAEKVSKLTAFIGEDLDARSMHGMNVAGGCYLLIARSPDSPVAAALRSHAARLAAMGIRVRAIFSEVDSAKPAHLMAPFSVPSECRLARDPRLLAAHEQLTLTAYLHLGRRLHAPRPRQARRPRALRRQLRPDWRPRHPLVREPVARHRAGLCDAVHHSRPGADARNAPPAKAFPTAYAASNGSPSFDKPTHPRGRCTAPASFAFAAWMQAGATGGNGR